jgi:hypothetical protein
MKKPISYASISASVHNGQSATTEVDVDGVEEVDGGDHGHQRELEQDEVVPGGPHLVGGRRRHHPDDVPGDDDAYGAGAGGDVVPRRA